MTYNPFTQTTFTPSDIDPEQEIDYLADLDMDEPQRSDKARWKKWKARKAWIEFRQLGSPESAAEYVYYSPTDTYLTLNFEDRTDLQSWRMKFRRAKEAAKKTLQEQGIESPLLYVKDKSQGTSLRLMHIDARYDERNFAKVETGRLMADKEVEIARD